jgi:hypothetical protein
LHDQNIIHTGKLGLYCAWVPWAVADALQMLRRTMS